MRDRLEWHHVGLCAYEDALRLQEALWQRRKRGGPDACVCVEHPPTVTVGRRATFADVLLPADALRERGVACVATERGGGATYHGPGQLVLYPIVALAARGLGVRGFVWRLEEIMIEVAAAFGVRAARDPRGPGVWTARGKLGAVGIRVRDGVATHGLALNVDPDLTPFGWIAPCSMPGLPVTRLVDEGARSATVVAAAVVARAACDRLLGSQPAARGRDAPEVAPL